MTVETDANISNSGDSSSEQRDAELWVSSLEALNNMPVLPVKPILSGNISER